MWHVACGTTTRSGLLCICNCPGCFLAGYHRLIDRKQKIQKGKIIIKTRFACFGDWPNVVKSQISWAQNICLNIFENFETLRQRQGNNLRSIGPTKLALYHIQKELQITILRVTFCYCPIFVRFLAARIHGPLKHLKDPKLWVVRRMDGWSWIWIWTRCGCICYIFICYVESNER